MKRPYVQIRTANQIESLQKHLDKTLPMFKYLPGIIGITLNGGMSRGYADHLSEIDVTLYLESKTYEIWRGRESPLTWGITKIEGTLYDIKIVDFALEKKRDWDNVDLWDSSYAKILYDPHHQLSALFDEKLVSKPAPEMAEGHLFQCWWYFRLAGDIWIYREDALQGHQIFNQAVVALVKTLFAANQEFVPHEKWLIHMSRSLPWKPADWENRLTQAMNTGDFSLTNLQDRQAAIENLWQDIDQYIIATYYPDLPVTVMQKTCYDLLQMLIEKETVTVDEWSAKTGLDILTRDPFHKIVTVTDNHITLDHERLLSVKPDDMYTWHYEILKTATGEKNENS